MHSPKTISAIRFLFFPFAFLYGIVIHIRNFLFDKKVLKSNHFSTPTICVGNLSVGGTGKTPMTEMLLSFFEKKYKTATLSRGYKRKTKGFLIANENTTALEIGDEPMQFHQNFPQAIVSVCEDRSFAIQQLEQHPNKPDLIILDDAMQHRKVTADCHILLSDYSNLYVNDFFLPVGSLRDQRSSADRANIIVVTKCPSNLGLGEKKSIEKKIKLLPNQQLFFSSISYGTPYNIFTKEEFNISQNDMVIAIAGIANPQPYFDYVDRLTENTEKVALTDHYEFSEQNIFDLFSKHKKVGKKEDIVYLVTEKDAVKIHSYQQVFINLSARIYVLPINCVILYNESDNFYRKIIAALDNIDN
ncbi:MAG: tetraacyldisaccharide 4'-kinase [Pseudopedobacter saltans]|uniref:Tetraacyldisaccharide 4'-kinase n=1 Tax=Pseudopedobacter saltans TaxID=151895 RepID=A0A2W5GRA2_9SPHI|nr:MAG: tetraacyldisaccharide 4'-kinase [Pseudopedobacter saltans]